MTLGTRSGPQLLTMTDTPASNMARCSGVNRGVLGCSKVGCSGVHGTRKS